MQKKFFRTLLGISFITLALFCGSGCTSVSLESNKDAAAVHKINRLFILINQGEVKSQPLSKSLAAAFENCFSNTPTRVDIAIASPLDLDESGYKSRMETFNADAVLVVGVQTFIVDQFGGYPTIMYDASLYDSAMKKREWRAAINNSGGTALMNRRMKEMSESIVSQLKLDGFL